MTNIIPESLAEKIISEKIEEWEEKRKKIQKVETLEVHPFLVISRDFGCGEEHIIPALEKKLGWPVYGKDLLDFMVEREGVSHAVLETLDEKGKAQVFDWVNYILGSGAILQKDYVLKISRLIKTIVLQESAIILGRGGNQILKEKPGGLRIKITAPFEDRVSHISQIRKMSLEKAVDLVRQIDNERREFVETYFHEDVHSMSGFDMIFNTKSFSEDALCKTIQFAMEERKRQSL